MATAGCAGAVEGTYEVAINFPVPEVSALDARYHIHAGGQLALDELVGKSVSSLPWMHAESAAANQAATHSFAHLGHQLAARRAYNTGQIWRMKTGGKQAEGSARWSIRAGQGQ